MRKIIKYFSIIYISFIAIISLTSCDFDVSSLFENNSDLASLLESAAAEAGVLPKETSFTGYSSDEYVYENETYTNNYETVITFGVDGSFIYIKECISTKDSSGSSIITNSLEEKLSGTYLIINQYISLNINSLNNFELENSIVDYISFYPDFLYYKDVVFTTGDVLLSEKGKDFVGYIFIIEVNQNDLINVFTGTSSSAGKYYQIYADGSFSSLLEPDYKYINSTDVSDFDSSVLGYSLITVNVDDVLYKAIMNVVLND